MTTYALLEMNQARHNRLELSTQDQESLHNPYSLHKARNGCELFLAPADQVAIDGVKLPNGGLRPVAVPRVRNARLPAAKDRLLTPVV